MNSQTPQPLRPTPTPPPVAAQPATILPILVSQGVLTSTQAAALPMGADNATIELYLKLNNLVNEQQLLQAYATLYQIPFIRLKNRKVKPEILGLIPELMARRYDVVAYDKHNDIVLVAMATPGRLRSEQREGLLHQLQRRLQIKISPAFAPLEDIRALFVGYEQLTAKAAPAPSAPQASTPPAAPATSTADQSAPVAAPEYPLISLLSRTIPVKLLQRFPREVCQHYHFVAFEETAPQQYSVAALEPASKVTHQIIDFIQQQNDVKITLYRTDEQSLQAALAQYDKIAPARPQESLPAERERQEREAHSAPAPLTTQITANPSLIQQAKQAVSAGVQAVQQAKEADKAPSTLEVTADQLITSPVLEAPTDNEAGSAPAKPVNENSLDAFLGSDVKSIQDLVQLVRSGNVPKMVAGIVSVAIAMRASDIHIEAEKAKIRLRYRIDGELEDIVLMPRLLLAPLVSRIKILSQMKIDENRIPQDGRFAVSSKTHDVDLRVSTLPTVYGEKVVIRILDKTTGIMSLEDMGLDGINLQRIVENIEKPYGIVLSTGPTGSGKSTTLYAALQRIAKPEVNVVTLEDPVEYEISGINQTQIKPKIGFTFAEGLRSILRQDPNIIMVGEIRDKETAEMATHSALTGHLVLSTLHTNSAAGALPRLINMGIEPFLITSSMNAVIGQRLVRRVCQKCKVEEPLPKGVLDEIAQELTNSNVEESLKNPANWKFYKGAGCPECSSGYKGRIGIFEVLTMSEQLEALAVKKEPASVMEAQALKEGMITMKQDGLVKALRGLTTVEEVMKATTE